MRLALIGFTVMSALLGCLSSSRNAGIRRQEGWRLRTCLGNSPYTPAIVTRQCIDESVARCQAQQLEKTCGIDEMYGNIP